ncbi:MAG TPA: fibronectin type III domain-containing protein [Nitrosomonas sp.]|uniref:fibronectin type III domain-containing protein n=1 Tax=Nitrosomonas sp. TaxID=42353 RepID=UPI002080C569|nr:fibronectin type III domain-containing protein [Nitrosomonas sp.]GJL75777.1 MAG: hypothetical protein NMNS02_18830 [Nitrosomonas sp.]HNP25427.1 fibronectin type III domain-containing protein [Nitrosomonas sp.]
MLLFKFKACAQHTHLSRLLLLQLKLLLFTTALFLPVSNSCAESITFANDRHLESDAGYILLNWNNQKRIPVELQRADQPAFEQATTLYRGNNSSLMLSGLPNGTYYYRIRAQTGTWSDKVILNVTHHSLIKAWLLFALGAFVFLSIAWVIMRGAADES